MSASGLSGRTFPIRYVVLGLLIAAGCISYIDRTAMAAANVDIAREFGLSFTELGVLLSSFASAYLICQIPAGLLADRVGGRWLLFACLLLWSAAQWLSALAGSVQDLLIARCLLGVSEAPVFLVGTRLITRYFEPDRRATPVACLNASSSLGQVIGPMMLGAVSGAFGWRAMFVFVGGLSAVLALLWIGIYRNPKAGVPAEAGVEPVRAEKVIHELRRLLSFRTSWALAGGFVGVIYLQWLYAAWLPTYFQTTRHFTVSQAGYLSSVPQFAGFIGGLAGGVVTDRLACRGWSPARACRTPLVIALLVAAATTMLAPFCATTTLSVFVMSVSLFATGIAMTAGWTLGTVLIDERSVATLEAIQNMGGSFGAVMAPVLTGAAVQHSGSFVLAMGVAGVITMGSAALYRWGTSVRIV
ncbi:MFS transporter [Acetobacter oeni]|uniref:MFS transporter n=1 Tax=Acetobacter oeni TaxID=304077 RepID=A0A511XLI6_9PROT|nr:MFS transporter [Acetobacter oeni]